jgi:Xaa-Pro aminopeptidase
MQYTGTDSQLFATNRANLRKLLLPNSLVIIYSDDRQPRNSAGALVLRQNSDLFYLTGIAQEETVLMLYPDSEEARFREILFLREPTPEMELREGPKLTKEEAKQISGIARVEWLGDFWNIFHWLMCLCERVYLNLDERGRLETIDDARFVHEVQRAYPLHEYQRLTPLLHRVRTAKSAAQLKLIEHAGRITAAGFGTRIKTKERKEQNRSWTDRTGKECFRPSPRSSKKTKRSTSKRRRAMPKR